MRDPQRLILLVATAASCVGLLACGGKTSSSTTTATQSAKTSTTESVPKVTLPHTYPAEILTPGPGTLGKVVATVAGRPITLATVQHEMVLASAPKPVPDPPSYANCVKQTRTEAENSPTPSPPKGEAELVKGCRVRYEELQRLALTRAIHAQWFLDEAREEGLKVTPQEVQNAFEVAKKQSFPNNAQFESYRKSTKQTVGDMMMELRLTKISERIYDLIHSKEHPISDAEVTAYYDKHKANFAIPSGRDVRIVRTVTEGSAIKVKQQLQAGKSFASVARELTAVTQPLGTKAGEIKDLKPHFYEEEKLNSAIFGAKLHQLTGPVQVITSHIPIAKETDSGFFIFEVLGTTPGRQLPLSKVKRLIATELDKVQKDKTRANFASAFRAKWISRTDCLPGYVVKHCKQFKISRAEEIPDRYTL